MGCGQSLRSANSSRYCAVRAITRDKSRTCMYVCLLVCLCARVSGDHQASSFFPTPHKKRRVGARHTRVAASDVFSPFSSLSASQKPQRKKYDDGGAAQ